MLGRVIRDISRFALVKVDQGSNSLQIHRLVQAVIRSQMTDEEQVEARHEVHKILIGARPRQGETDDPANWSTYDIIWPHLGPSMAEECDDPRTRQLLIDWVRYQWKHGEFEAGLALARRLENLWAHQLGARPPADPAPAVPDRQRAALPGPVRRGPGPGHLRAGTAAGRARARPSARPDDRERAGCRPARARRVPGVADRGPGRPTRVSRSSSARTTRGLWSPRTTWAARCAWSGDCSAARRLDEETLDRQRQVLGHEHPEHAPVRRPAWPSTCGRRVRSASR